MANSSKYIKLQKNILLEWEFDSQNIMEDNYQVLNDIKLNQRSYMSKTGLNRIENTAFVIDSVIKKYALVDTTKYNYLKIENYMTSPIQFDKLRIYLPTSYSFVDNGYIGMYIRTYTYDYENKKIINFSSYLYDDTLIRNTNELSLNQEFRYDEQSWGKYLTYSIPNINSVSKQRTSTIDTNLPSTNSINKNLTSSNGISTTSPIFIEFAFVISREEVLGNTYYYLSDKYTKSISKEPEYLDLAANIVQATDGDYFEIYGSYGGDNESMDDFIDEIYSKGKKVKIEYEVTLYEENVLMNTQTYTVTQNYTQKILYRPIISFSNTTASIDVTMKIIDLVDNTSIDRLSSISLTKDIFKYGKKLNRINIDNAWKPKIYNKKAGNISTNPNIKLNDINLDIVNYPVISDRIDILVEGNPGSSSYKSMGNAEIIINRYDTTIKFKIAKKIDDDGNVTPYNLTEITENSDLYLSFKSDTKTLEKPIWKETEQNDFENGTIYFKISSDDYKTLNSIGLENNNFSIILKSKKSGVSSLLYFGKWVNLDDVVFEDNESGVNALSNEDFIDGLTDNDINNLLENSDNIVNQLNNNPNSNILIFLNPDSDLDLFKDYVNSLNLNVWLEKPGGNTDTLTYLYFVLNVSPTIVEDIKKQDAVDEVIKIPFCLGANIDGVGKNLSDSLIKFNCDLAEKIKFQNNKNIKPTGFDTNQII